MLEGCSTGRMRDKGIQDMIDAGLRGARMEGMLDQEEKGYRRGRMEDRNDAG